MALTEKQVEEMAAAVGDADLDLADPESQQWVETQIEGSRRTEKQLRTAWRYARLMRDDTKMEAINKDLATIRQSIAVLESMREEVT